MFKRTHRLSALALLLCIAGVSYAQGTSVYTVRPDDTLEARYFDVSSYGLKADGKADVSDALQAEINSLKNDLNYGTLFIPEGKYLISKTIYIPTAIRVIGYGKTRPEIILKDNAPLFDTPANPPSGLTDSKFMFWFTGSVVEDPSQRIVDANAGTFYSGMSNIDIRIGKGNPYASALRTHYAQHCVVSHMDINVGSGFAGIVDVGNELADVHISGGQYAIHTMMCSPSWPMMLIDASFEGQKKACVHSFVGGLTFYNCHFKNAPLAYEMAEGAYDRVFFEACHFENIKEAALSLSMGERAVNQINILDSEFKEVPTFLKHASGKSLPGGGKIYRVKEYSFGLHSSSLEDPSDFKEVYLHEPLSSFAGFSRTLPVLPDMKTWINVKDFGAMGDGQHDDTDAIFAAMERGDNLYFPQGKYRITRTLQMKQHTRFLGFHPFATQIMIQEGTPAFSGFGSPAPLVESSVGGDNMLCSIGINSGANNYRAVGVKWMAGEDSYLYDVKFIGGHGTMFRGQRPAGLVMLMGQASGVSTPDNPIYTYGQDLAWDSQYWSLWVTNGGGGTFRSIWTANSYAGNGIFVNNTSTPSKMFAISIEHHCRNEVRFDNVSNWKIYDIQTEEEGKEGTECLAIELNRCSSLQFANVFMMRVYRVTGPMTWSIRTWDCRDIDFYNIHNYGQNRYTASSTLYDVNTRRNAPSWEMSNLRISGNESRLGEKSRIGKVTTLADGFEFAENIVADSRGNIYFSEALKKTIYKYSPVEDKLSVLFESTYKPVGLAVDSNDNLLVVIDYAPQSVIDGKPEQGQGPTGNFLTGMGYRMMFSISVDDPYGSITPMDRIPAEQVRAPQYVWYPSSTCSWFGFETSLETRPDSFFMAPDGKTYVADVIGLARCSSLSRFNPGSKGYMVDENNRRFFEADVTGDGMLSAGREFALRGEFGWAMDKDGNFYIADGDIHVYGQDKVQKGVIVMPERPTAVVVSGNVMYATSRNSLYEIEL